ncbi:MAG: peptidoglycan glycosyltransferase [Ruminococcus sp.]|uniref:penicillin-binding transpeptidase domain-containing protein n=1 Tax=Ruminococcus sp. TaxID=41978 RepID=UPI0025E94947|nr:penicillin-binding transpeptidase domain-containing protein [Ruminococcus sp.]MCR5599633.1 peptidoglycan glycosyltransferase [Ruminococcus sp.]
MKIKRFAAFAASLALLAGTASCSSSVGQANTDDTPSAATSATTVPAETTTAQVTTVPAETKPAANVRKGSIFDAKGKLLVSAGEDGKRRVFADNYAVSFANIIAPMSEGFDLTFDKQLTTPMASDSSLGQSIKLTLDGDVQNEIYSYMESNNIVGTVVVLRTDGSIMAQVNYPSYDPNTVADQSPNDDLAWGDTGNKAFSNYEPGSCFKIMSEVIADKHGVYSVHDDGTWEVGGFPIVNWDHETNKGSYPIERSLSSAFVNSSNIFFAKAFDQIGADAVLADLSSIFHFGADDNIKCDFGELNNNIEIYCDDDLRRSAFGQSYVLTCPIYLAALGREAAFGDMVTPFVVKDIVDTNDSSVKIGSGSADNEVIASIPVDYRQNLLNGMSAVGSDIGVYVPGGYSFYAKTGTAEGWKGDFLYITGCARNNNDSGSSHWDSYDSYGETGSYVMVMEIQNPVAHGFEFASQSAGIYSSILNIVIGR